MNVHGDAKLIMGALVKARGEIGATVGKDAKGNFGKYATLASITEATTAALAKHGLAILQEAELNSDGVTVSTWMVHDSGAMLEFVPLTMPLTDRKPQAVGSAITYARRYQLVSICGLAPDDDDGQAAQDATKPAQAAQKPATLPKQPSGQNATKPLVTTEQLADLDTVGRQFYEDEWEEQLPKLVQAVTKGATSNASDLQPNECAQLFNGIQRKMAGMKVAA